MILKALNERIWWYKVLYPVSSTHPLIAGKSAQFWNMEKKQSMQFWRKGSYIINDTSQCSNRTHISTCCKGGQWREAQQENQENSIFLIFLGLLLISLQSIGVILSTLDLVGFLSSCRNNVFQNSCPPWKYLRMRSHQWCDFVDEIEFSDLLSGNLMKTEFALVLVIFAQGIGRNIFARRGMARGIFLGEVWEEGG